MDAPLPITGLQDLSTHLNNLLTHDTTTTTTTTETKTFTPLPLNTKLFDSITLQLTESNIPPLIPSLLPKLTLLLQSASLTPDLAKPIVELTIKLLSPIPFTQVLQLATEESLLAALESPFPQINLLGLEVIAKAGKSAQDAAILSVMPKLFKGVVERWLISPEVGVGEKGGKVLGDLLEVDSKKVLWELVFGGQDEERIYEMIIEIVSGRHEATKEEEKQLSLAQGRLLRVLPRLAGLDLGRVSKPRVHGTPVRFTNGDGHGNNEEEKAEEEGLLQFAALRMVDKGDVLMHLSLVDFFEAFVSFMRLKEDKEDKVGVTRDLLREALKDDEVLKEALITLPDRTVEEEAEELRRWLEIVLPEGTVRDVVIR
ncbi:hypothetical protein QBC38DRAFT_477718 [Podospora fimiseda]|uniref:DNA mismatch repair protein HSM3 N-terminal domain-containing protein n=1 Tax=Podospora fimiseda TaxID=252190 RepID=A0AAN7BQ49_9PEZI|nr:hypothetical protein QBC38DRAFT_477718 [Podospora fimiseda]